MTPFLGGKRRAEQTTLVLDVENGSVGGALVRLTPDGPRLFGDHRFHIPLLKTRDSGSLTRAISDAARHVLRHMGEIAARIRQHKTAHPLGHVESARLYMAAPWGVPDLSLGSPRFIEPFADLLQTHVSDTFGYIPMSLHTSAGAAVHGMRMLYPAEPNIIGCIIHGEITEILVLEEGRVIAHATAPVGRHTILRTLTAHGGMTAAEARSALRLPIPANTPVGEATALAAAHIADELADTIRPIIRASEEGAIVIIAHDPYSNWFAQTLSSSERMADLFSKGGTVRTIRGKHIAPYMAAYNGSPDTILMLQSLLVDNRPGR